MGSPLTKCPKCQIKDWSWNEILLDWRCAQCGGMPDGETLSADEWCDETLKSYDLAAREHQELVNVPVKEGESALLRSARLRRAEKKLAAANAKAYAATLLLQLMQSIKTGEIQLNLPDLQVNVKLIWKSKQTTDQ